MWLVKSSWFVHCLCIDQFYWVIVRCRSEFALWWFFVRKNCRHSAGCFSFFLVLTTRHSLSFHKFERHSCLFGLIMHCSLLNGNWECLVLISVFSVESCLFMCLSVMRFFSLQVFQFLISVWLILSFCCVQYYIWYYNFDLHFFIHLFNSNGVVVVALANLRWTVFVALKLSQIGSFHELLVLATECFFSFNIFELNSDAFLVC